MKKRVFGRKLSRARGARTALMRALVRALLENGKIVTTKAKAKFMIPQVDKLSTLALKGDIRRISAFFGNDRVRTEKFTKLVRSFSGRKSGFTRITHLPPRLGDAAPMARLEWVEQIVKNEKEDGKKSNTKAGKLDSKKKEKEFKTKKTNKKK